MSSPLAIASVTAVLKDLLNNGLIDHSLASTVGNVTVTALSPDRIDVTTLNQQSQLNLFLYQVTPNAGWRNVGLPSRDSRGERTSNPPLAIDLHYLLTAYGALELHSEILLGYGMQRPRDAGPDADGDRTALAPPTAVAAAARRRRLQPSRRSWPSRSSRSRSARRSTPKRFRACGRRSRRTNGPTVGITSRSLIESKRHECRCRSANV